ncbi:hypothetical protein ACYZTX_00390 [Pseudomonas sp. MDT1-17]
MKIASLMLCFSIAGDLVIFFFVFHHLLKAAQHHGLSTADYATECNQTAFEDCALDVFDQPLVMACLKITGLIQG